MANPENPRCPIVQIQFNLDDLASSDPNTVRVEVANRAYQFGQALFEMGGENNRRPDGTRIFHRNGHHLAQQFVERVLEQWDEATSKA
jgi:hypothetical protein